MQTAQLKAWPRHKRLVVAVIETEAALVERVRRLQQVGVPVEQMSLLALNRDQAENEFGLKGETVEDLADEAASHGRSERDGMIAGGGMGLLLSLAVFAVPGLGATLLAAGPVVMAVNVLVHMGAGGLGLGMILGAIFDERVTEDHRDYYRECLQRGNCLLIVHGDDALIEKAQQELSGDHVRRLETF